MATAKRPGIRVSQSYVDQHPDADPTATEFVLNLLVAAHLVLERLESVVRPLSLTATSFNVLQILDGDPEPLSPSEITARYPLPMTTATMTGVLDTCQRRGYVRRSPHPTDRRRILVELTDRGRKVRAEAEALVIAAEHEWVSSTTQAGRQRLTNSLGELVEALRPPSTA